MKVRRRPRTTWAGRLLRGWRFDRNSLRRGIDRAETVIVLVLLAAFGCGAWFGAHAAANWMAARAVHEMRAQQASFRQVRAVLLEQPTPAAVYGAFVAPHAQARWTAPDGSRHTGDVTAPLGAPIGSTVPTWVDHSGNQVTPLQPDVAAVRADAAATAAVGGAGVAALLLGLAVHRALDRRRLVAWDVDWLATGPRWTTRRLGRADRYVMKEVSTMTRSEMHLEAMLRHLGAAYYDSTQGRASRSDVTRALDAVAEQLDETPSHHATATGHPRANRDPHPAHGHQRLRRWARQVGDVMTTQVVTVDRITPYKEIARLLAEHRISGVPVLMMRRQVAGVVSETDLVAAEVAAAKRTQADNTWWRPGKRWHAALTAGQLMTEPAITIRPDAPIPTAARVMNTRHVHRLPVVNEDGQLVGIVSRRDLLSVLLRADEEIADDVRQVLGEIFGPDSTDVTVSVRNGVVTLTTTIPAATDSHDEPTLAPAAQRLIWGVDGVIDVVDKLHTSAA